MSPSRATYQRMGREKAMPESFQRMDFSNLMLSTSLGNASTRTSGVGRPFCLTTAATYFPPSISRASSVAGSRLFFLAKPSAACVGLPSLSKALSAGGFDQQILLTAFLICTFLHGAHTHLIRLCRTAITGVVYGYGRDGFDVSHEIFFLVLLATSCFAIIFV